MSGDKSQSYNQMYDQVAYAIFNATHGSKDVAELQALIASDAPADYIRFYCALPFEQYLKTIVDKIQLSLNNDYSDFGDESSEELEEQLEQLAFDIDASDSLSNIFTPEPELNDPWPDLRHELEGKFYYAGLDADEILYLIDILTYLHYRGDETVLYGEAPFRYDPAEFTSSTNTLVKNLLVILAPAE